MGTVNKADALSTDPAGKLVNMNVSPEKKKKERSFRNYLNPLCFVIDHPRAPDPYKRGGLTLPNEQFAD